MFDIRNSKQPSFIFSLHMLFLPSAPDGLLLCAVHTVSGCSLLILQATFAVMFLWEATEQMGTSFLPQQKASELPQFASRWHEARDPRGGTESNGFQQRPKGPAFWLYTNWLQYTLTNWRTLNSTTLKNGEQCRHSVIYDGVGNQNLKPKLQTSRMQSWGFPFCFDSLTFAAGESQSYTENNEIGALWQLMKTGLSILVST